MRKVRIPWPLRVLMVLSVLTLLLRVPVEPSAERAQALTAELLASRDDRPMDFYARAFAAYALVNVGLSDPLRRPELARSVDALIQHVREPGFARGFGNVRSVGYAGHLLLMLEGRQRLGRLPPGLQATADTLLESVAAEVLASPSNLLPTYGERIWPADNEVLAAALSLAVTRAATSARVRRASEALTIALRSLEREALPPSEVDAMGKPLASPRGCALSWTVAMRALAGERDGALLYQRYRREYFMDEWSLAGFREWPRGVTGREDSDSGPIVFGRGVAASGIGLAAATLVGAQSDARSMWRTAAFARWVPGLSKTRKMSAARAMLLWAETARRWEPPL